MMNTAKSDRLHSKSIQVIRSNVMRSGSPGVHSCDSLLCPGCNGGSARDAAESWLLAPQQNDSGHQAEEKTNGPCCFWAHKALRYLAHLRPKP